MAVFTEVPFDTAQSLIARLHIGELTRLEGCAGGIENTNYFADTTGGRYVLTLFERLTAEQLPFYLQLMKHLASRGIPVPDPQADAGGQILHSLLGKPAAVVEPPARPPPPGPGRRSLRRRGRHAGPHAPGRAPTSPCTSPTCAAWPGGARRCQWCCPTSTEAQRRLIEAELAFQQQLAASPAHAQAARRAPSTPTCSATT